MKQQEGGGEMNCKPQAQQPQKCPRCDSLNTKFCYYNNYSLSQPRYFCKSCRRYWTQGGTLRNVRVGGGCRKPKRTKGSASSSSSSADTSSAPSFSQPPREVAEIQKDTSAACSASAAAVPLISPFYQGGACGDDDGYLSSLAAIQSPFNQMGSCSNLSLLSGFGAPPIRPSSQPFYQMSAIRDKEEENLYEADQVLIQSSTANSGSASTHSHHDWTESFINNVNHRGPDASLWSTTMSTTSTSGNSRSHNDTVGGSFSFIPNHQWPDLPEYDPPPPP